MEEQDTKFITFDVSGTIFKTYHRTILLRLGLLSDMISDIVSGIVKENTEENQIFIDENYKFFAMMLDYYCTGMLSKVRGMSDEVLNFKLKYWGIQPVVPIKKDVKQLCRTYIEYFIKGSFLKEESGGYQIRACTDTVVSVDPDKLQSYGFEKYNLIITPKTMWFPIGMCDQGYLWAFRFGCDGCGHFKDKSLLLNLDNKYRLCDQKMSNVSKTSSIQIISIPGIRI
jgi:hypothetical protein